MRILILGAGFAGLWAAIGAARKLDEMAMKAAAEILVVDRNPYHNIRVRNYEADLSDVAIALGQLLDPRHDAVEFLGQGLQSLFGRGDAGEPGDLPHRGGVNGHGDLLNSSVWVSRARGALTSASAVLQTAPALKSRANREFPRSLAWDAVVRLNSVRRSAKPGGRRLKPLLVAAVAAALALSSAHAETRDEAGKAWWSHIKFLAGDELQGRLTGSPAG